MPPPCYRWSYVQHVFHTSSSLHPTPPHLTAIPTSDQHHRLVMQWERRNKCGEGGGGVLFVSFCRHLRGGHVAISIQPVDVTATQRPTSRTTTATTRRSGGERLHLQHNRF